METTILHFKDLASRMWFEEWLKESGLFLASPESEEIDESTYQVSIDPSVDWDPRDFDPEVL